MIEKIDENNYIKISNNFIIKCSRTSEKPVTYEHIFFDIDGNEGYTLSMPDGSIFNDIVEEFNNIMANMYEIPVVQIESLDEAVKNAINDDNNSELIDNEVYEDPDITLEKLANAPN